MELRIFTMPMCDKCKAIKEYLRFADIGFTEIDLGDDDGVVELRKIYPKLKDRVKRTDDGQLPIPLIVGFENSEVVKVSHTLEEVKVLVS